MAFQSVPETAQIEHVMTLNGITVQNVHYCKRPGGYALSDLQAIADIIDPIFTTTFKTDVCSDVSYVKTVVRGLEFINDLEAEQSAGSDSGTHTTSSVPNNVTFAIKKSSGLTGRSARGRSFWIGVPRDELQTVNENLLETIYAANIVADIDFIRTRIELVGLWEAVLVSRFTLGAAREFGKTFPWVATSNVNLRVDSHRSRLPNP